MRNPAACWETEAGPKHQQANQDTCDISDTSLIAIIFLICTMHSIINNYNTQYNSINKLYLVTT